MKIMLLSICSLMLACCGGGKPYIADDRNMYSPPEKSEVQVRLRLLQNDFHVGYYDICEPSSQKFKTLHKRSLLELEDRSDTGVNKVLANVKFEQAIAINFYGRSVSGTCTMDYTLFPEEGKNYRIIVDEKDGETCHINFYEELEDGTTKNITKDQQRNMVPCKKIETGISRDTYQKINYNYNLCNNLTEHVNQRSVRADIDFIAKKTACKNILTAKNKKQAKREFSSALIKFEANEDTQESNIFFLKNGGPYSINRAAASIYRNGETSTTVLDVAAETLLQRYKKPKANAVNALAWLIRAIGNSGSGRYYSVMQEVYEHSEYRKLRGYAKKAMDIIGNKEGTQYQRKASAH